MRLKYIFLVFIIIPCCLYSQDKIETDRPNETETPYTVPKTYVQAESGFNKENKKNGDWTFIHPTALLKYGISKTVEFRLGASLITDYTHPVPQPIKETYLEPILLGAKVALLDEKGIIPKTSLITQVSLPFLAGEKGKTSHAAPSFRLAMQNTVSKNISLSYNVGAEWNGESSNPFWLYTFAPGFDLGKKWYCFIESYGFITKGDSPDHNLDAGLAYLISNDIQLDLAGGVGLSENSLRNYIAVGFSFRFKTSR